MILVAGLSFNAFLHSSAQITFQKTFGGSGEDLGSCVQQTRDGGYVIVGATSSFGAGGSDVYLIKTSAAGDTVWTKTFGRHGSAESGHSVQQTKDDGYIIAFTYFLGPGTGDIYLIKTNNGGDSLWTKTFGGWNDDDGYSALQTMDGGFVLVGGTSSFGDTDGDVYLIKTNATGDTVWTRTFGGSSYDAGYSIQETTDKGYVIAGRTYSFGAVNGDVFLIKTNASGDTLWTKVFGGNSYESGQSVRQTIDGGYVIGGWTYSFGAGNSDAYLIKTDATGDTVWAKTFGGGGYEFGNSVQQTIDGGYVLAGFTSSSGAGFHDVYLIKINADGDTVWTRTFGGSGYEEGRSVGQTTDGGYVIAGYTTSFGEGKADVYLIKTNADGIVSVPGEKNIPAIFTLGQNYPNPFNPSTTIEFELPTSLFVSLKVYNMLGQEVATLVNEAKQPGRHEVKWITIGQASGVYFCRLQSGQFFATRKLVLIR